MGRTSFSGPVYSANGFEGDFTGTTDNLAIDDNLSVGGDASVGGALTVAGAADLQDGATVMGGMAADIVMVSNILQAPSYAYDNLPLASTYPGGLLLCTDADPAAALCFSNGTNWIDLLTGTTVTDGN